MLHLSGPSALLFGGGVFFGILSLILFFGDPQSPGLVGRCAHFLIHSLPSLLYRYSGLGKVFGCGKRAAHCFFGRPHPVIQLVYVALVVGCYGLFVWHGYPLLPNRFLSGSYHKPLGALNFAVCVVTFILASFVNPGTITKENNAAYLAAYPSDNFMFPADRTCTSCGIVKPARSKHCRVTDRCVAKFDHHCIWLNNTVGERNYRWFMAYLLSNSVLMLYGAFAALTIFLTEIQALDLFNATFVNNTTGQKMKAGYGIVFQYLLAKHNALMMVSFIATIMGLVISGFSLYHVWLAGTNTTTNETFKWKEARWHHREAEEMRLEQVETTAKDLLQDSVMAARFNGSIDAARKFVNAKLEGVAPIPPNAYDTGSFWANISEVVYPPSRYGREKSWREAFRKRVENNGFGGTAGEEGKDDDDGAGDRQKKKGEEAGSKGGVASAGTGGGGNKHHQNLKKRR